MDEVNKACAISPEEHDAWRKREALRRAREEMRAWAEDLEALRPHLDTVHSDSVKDSWELARSEFAAACREYADAVKEVDDLEVIYAQGT